MELRQALAIIARLADGRDPGSGKPLPREHLCQHPDMIRALALARVSLERDVRREQRMANARDRGVTNAGHSWTPDEDHALLSRYKGGVSVDDLSAIHGRSTGAIRARLERLGQPLSIGPAPPPAGQSSSAPPWKNRS